MEFVFDCFTSFETNCFIIAVRRLRDGDFIFSIMICALTSPLCLDGIDTFTYINVNGILPGVTGLEPAGGRLSVTFFRFSEVI